MGGDDGRYGWLGLPRGTEPPGVIAISLRGLSSIKHAQQSLMPPGAISRKQITDWLDGLMRYA
jgi:hypothetical protein